jgi:hypothetical protein
MSRSQNLRWRKKHLAVAAIAFTLSGYTALSAATASASNDGEWGCSELSSLAVDSCTTPTDSSYDTVPDSIPVDSIPDTVPDTVPDTTPHETDPSTTQAPAVLPPAPSSTPAPVVPAQVAPETVLAPAASLPVTGRGSIVPSLFIAVGLFGAGSVALAFARRGSAARTNQS